ncbi:VanZ family protein [Brevibacillus parabrevis]|uniref:VanZ family protein n=1 Tax=Brevibacillus parabrevis TaxID=54914 RepID=UPI001C22EEEF|nr:VanZ family protein [Brevibacillus parabrevis]MBU8713244.1 VanZ family protein [Brevibacillus parabrevis]WDV95376.1 VanZ family protein [Brevibacillus parabrevis]
MSAYFIPIQTAFIAFILLGFVLVIPWLIYSYRKYGFLSLWASIVAYSFMYYMLSALFLVLLPLPESRNTCAYQSADTVYYSLIPFSFVTDTLKDGAIVLSNPATYMQIFKQSAFWQAAFNFLLLLPFGVYLRYFWQDKRYWKKAFGFGFALSLFYEVTQVTGIYGIYNCPYRIFDVDDLMLNSTGALAGYWIGPIILALFPSKKTLLAKKAKIESSRLVPPLSQLLAVWVDYFLIQAVWLVTIGLFSSNDVMELVYTTVGFLVVYFVLPLLWSGQTVGTRLLRFRLAGPQGEVPSWKALLKRAFALYLPWGVSTFIGILNRVEIDMDSALYPIHVWMTVVLFACMAIMVAVLCLHVVLVLLKKGERTFYFDAAADIVPSKK